MYHKLHLYHCRDEITSIARLTFPRFLCSLASKGRVSYYQFLLSLINKPFIQKLPNFFHIIFFVGMPIQ